MVKANETLGSYLVDDMGFTLYYFANDQPESGSSSCYGECAANWPPFYAVNLTVPSELNDGDFTTFARDDGVMQTAYKGWPLYTFKLDVNPGDVMGQGQNQAWFVVNLESFPPA